MNLVDQAFLDSLPQRYKETSDKEQRALDIAANFRQQYSELYPTRMPLLIAPKNEAAIEKVVCTFIRPCLLEYTEFYNWESIAAFIKDYLTPMNLENATELPTQLSSPQTIIDNQAANCFEYSNVLVSLLVGSGYDAYVGEFLPRSSLYERFKFNDARSNI